MGEYQDLAKNIPWSSFGRETVASRVARSLIPVGFLPYQTKKLNPGETPTYVEAPNVEDYVMHIVGTAIAG